MQTDPAGRRQSRWGVLTLSASIDSRIPATFVALLVLFGCGPDYQGPERLPTIPVRGQVTVNGLPAPGLIVKFHPEVPPVGEVAIYASNPTALTEGDGSFTLSTYEHGDGIAAGSYFVTFQWLEFNRISNSYGGPDKLGDKYSDPRKSEFKVTVTGDEPEGVDLEPFLLKK